MDVLKDMMTLTTANTTRWSCNQMFNSRCNQPTRGGPLLLSSKPFVHNITLMILHFLDVIGRQQSDPAVQFSLEPIVRHFFDERNEVARFERQIVSFCACVVVQRLELLLLLARRRLRNRSRPLGRRRTCCRRYRSRRRSEQLEVLWSRLKVLV